MENYFTPPWFLATALAYLGKPYIWGGDDPSGFDCSGFVLECLKTVGIIDETDDFTADSLFKFLTETNPFTAETKPVTGALLFYKNHHGKYYHVTICLDETYQIGASGGDSTVTNNITAWNENAYVKIRPIEFNPDIHTILILKEFVNENENN